MKLATLLAAAIVLAPFAAHAQTPMQHDTDKPMHMEKAPVPPSKSLNIVFQGRTTTLSLADLLNMPQVTIHVHNAHTNKDETYSGPLVSDVLAKAGLISSKETEPIILHSSVIATGTDNYFVLFSAAELQPAFSRSQAIVAIMKFDLPDTDGGLIQIINTDGARPARWVHGLANLNVVSIAPSH